MSHHCTRRAPFPGCSGSALAYRFCVPAGARSRLKNPSPATTAAFVALAACAFAGDRSAACACGWPCLGCGYGQQLPVRRSNRCEARYIPFALFLLGGLDAFLDGANGSCWMSRRHRKTLRRRCNSASDGVQLRGCETVEAYGAEVLQSLLFDLINTFVHLLYPHWARPSWDPRTDAIPVKAPHPIRQTLRFQLQTKMLRPPS